MAEAPAGVAAAEEARSGVLEAAQVLYLSGVNTSSVLDAAERLGARLGVPGRMAATWGELQYVTAGHVVSAVPARPEAVDMRAAQAVTDATAAFDRGAIGLSELRRRVAGAADVHGAPLLPFAVAAVAGAVVLSVLWGLSVPQGLVLVGAAAGLGAVVRRWLARRHVGLVSQIFAAALIGGLVGAAAGRLTPWSPGELVALGPGLVLVPGPQLMNGGLDVSGGRITLGIARLVHAAITIGAISAGVLLGLAAGGLTLPAESAAVVLPPYADVLLAAVAAGSYAVFFDMPWRLLPVPVVIGGGVHLLHAVLADDAGWNLAIASGAAALVAGAIAIPVSERLHVPFAGIGFASVVAMMPSVFVHRSVSGLLQLIGREGRTDPALLQTVVFDAATAVLVILALVLGTVIPMRVYRAVRGRSA